MPVEDMAVWFDGRATTLGDRIAGAREAAGISRQTLARSLGVRTATVAAWEDDRAEPRANRLQMAAGMMNVTVGWLLTGSGDGPAGLAEHDATQGARDAVAELRSLRADLSGIVARLGALEARLAAGRGGEETP